MAIKFSNLLIFRGPPKYTRIGIFGMKIYHLATLSGMGKNNFIFMPCLPTSLEFGDSKSLMYGLCMVEPN
jgi:hypothetical protein